jgi:hypothetical protein
MDRRKRERHEQSDDDGDWRNCPNDNVENLVHGFRSSMLLAIWLIEERRQEVQGGRPIWRQIL